MVTYNSIDIAKKIISRTESKKGDIITNLKLQKLLYYMQGFHLAMFNTPLFEEEIEAWQYGPVVPSVYDFFKSYGSGALPEAQGEVVKLEDIQERLFNEVFRIYNAYSAIGLMEMTHTESPWRSTPTGIGNIISKDKLQSFFKKRIR